MDHHHPHHHPYNPQQYNDSRYFPLPPFPNLLPHHYYNHHHHHHPPPPQPPPPPPLPPPQYHHHRLPSQPPPQYYQHTNQHLNPEPYRPFPHSPRVSSNHARVYNESHRLKPWRDHDVKSTSLPFNQGVAGYDPHYHRARDDRQQFYPPRVSSVAVPVPNFGFDHNPEPSGIHAHVDFNRISPSFREIDEFRREFRSDELRDWGDDRRVIEDVERDRIQGQYFHEEYHPEMLQGEFVRERDDKDLIRDGIMMDEDINAVRYSDSQAPLVSRDLSCAPIQFRNSNDDGYGEFYEEEGINCGSESGRYYDRGRSRQETQDYNRTPKKNTRKKSALLRIQPSKHSSLRNRQDTTSSPHKGKESLEGLDNRLSDERDVELDVSFKSNSLVAKAIMSAPAMDPNDSSDLDGLDIRVRSSKSLAKAVDNRNCTDSSSISRKRGGLLSNMGRSNSKSPLKRGSTHRESPKRELSNKDDTNVGLGKVPSFSIRKMRKSNVLLSRLSSSPAMTDVKLEKVNNSDTHPSGSSTSVACVKQAGKESSSNGQVVGPVKNETIIGVEDMDVRGPVIVQAVGHTVPKAPLCKKVRKKAVLESHGSSRKLGSIVSKAPGKTKRCAKDMQTISKTDEDVVRSGDKYISDLCTDGHGSQIVVPVLLDNGSGEGSSRQLISVGGNVDDIDIDIDIDIVSVDLDIGNSTSGPFGASVKIPDRVDVTCSVNADKPCETHVISSPETGIIEQSCGEERLDGNDNNQNEMENHDFLLTSSKATITRDKTVTPFSHGDIAVHSEKLTTAHGCKATDDIQDQQCRGEGTMLVNDAENKGTKKAFVSEDVDITSVSMKEDAPGLMLKRKRKSRNEVQYLNLGNSGSSHDVAVGKSGIMMNSNLPVEKSVSIVLGLPCSTAELALYQKKLKNSCHESISSIHVHNSYAVEDPSHYSKKNEISFLESSDLPVSQNYDLPASSDSLISTAKVGLNSVEHSTQSAEGTEVSNTVLVEKSILGGATNQLQTGRYCFANDASADFSYGDHCKSVNENSPLDGGLSSFLPKQEGNLNLVMSGAVDGSESVALESEGRIPTSHQSGGIHCMEIDNIGDSIHEPQVMDIGSDDNVAVNDNLPSEPDPPNLHAKGTDYGATTNCDVVTVQSLVGSSEGGSSLIHSSDFRTVSPLTLLSVGKLAIDAERSSKRIVTQGSLSSHSNSIVKNNLTNSKLGISAAPVANQPFAKKYVTPVKNAKITTFPPVNPISRQFVRRNVLVRADGNSSSIRASPITTPNKAPSTYPVKPRTWRRTDNLPASNTSVKKPSSSTVLNKPPIDRTVKVQSTSYIRKGNILVRNPTSRAATLGPGVVGATINQSKANVSNTSKLIGSHKVIESTLVPDSLMAGGRNAHVEMPKTPPLPCNGVISDHEIGYLGHCRSFQPVGEPEAVDNEELIKSFVSTPSSSRNPVTDVDKSLEDSGTLSDGNFPASESKRVVYLKRKSNQLIAASNSTKSSMHMDNTPALSSDNGYYKRRKNQLIRASSESNIQQLVAKVGNSLYSQPQKTLNVYSGRNSTKRQSNKGKPQKVSLVWKLGDTKSFVKGVDPVRCGKLLSHLLPWKRATWRSVWRSSTALSNNSSLITRKLLSSRKRAAIYVRSGHGFSLRRSKVISLGGSSLKWSKSMEKRSKKADEEASLAIAALHSVQRPKTGASGERIFRIGTFRYRMDPSRRTLQRITDEGSSNPAKSKAEYGARKTYVPKRLLIGSDEYVRIGNGNQLVRDPKRRTRLLASEKVRWSLHTARMRLAKKRKFCQFFTRFGKCNKGEGKCPYVHDPSKIAVCTKFLKGLCNDPSCKLTHQVIPERMPDCSFFLQGSCSNKNCPYRHVNVNPKAPICESFLRGYCAEGNECRKKHSYICPEFEATDNCPEGSKCKLYHPTKKEGKGKKKKNLKNQTYANSRGRYFRPVVGTTLDLEREMLKKLIAPKGAVLQETEELGDFIRLDVGDDEQDAEPMSLLWEGEADLQLDELDELIKPFRLLDSS